VTEFRTRQDGTVYPVQKSGKRYRKAYYTTFEERYFDCPNCGVIISDWDNYELKDENNPDKAVDIHAGSTGVCENCGTKIRIEGEE